VIDHGQIAAGRATISSEFLKAVQGPATQKLVEKDRQAAALGQHLHATTTQRGLHGTAAAIEVLAEMPGAEARDYTRRLVHYVDEQSTIERLLADHEVSQEDITTSERNVIKMSEVLYALGSVPTSVGPREGLATRIADELESHRNPDGGWPYFMAASPIASHSHLLPTAYAARALDRHGYDISKSATFLRDHIRAPISVQTDIFVQTLVVYVLCYLPDSYRNDREIRKPFETAWGALSPLLDQDLEANIEYLTTKINYVRIPWQLYLLASAARISPYRRFVSAKAQRRLKSILDNVRAQGGLLYPHSGRDLSTRTNAILFEVLSQIDDQLKVRRLPLRPFVLLELVRSVIASRLFQYTLRILVLGFVTYTIVNWATSRHANVSELAPELIGSLLLILMTGKRDA
jgi:hypothetical protein